MVSAQGRLMRGCVTHSLLYALTLTLTLTLTLASALPVLSPAEAAPPQPLSSERDELYVWLKRLTRHPDAWARFGARAQASLWRASLTDEQLDELLGTGKERDRAFADLKHWQRYERALTHHPAQLQALRRALGLLSDPWVSPAHVDPRAPLKADAWRRLPPALREAGLSSSAPWGGAPLNALWAWRARGDTPTPALLCAAHNVQLFVWLNGEALGERPAHSAPWLDQSCWGLSLTPGVNHLLTRGEGGGRWHLRLLTPEGAPLSVTLVEPAWGAPLEASPLLTPHPPTGLWGRALARVDRATHQGARGRASLSDEALLGVAHYAALAEVPEAQRLSPVIEAHMRWERALRRRDMEATLTALESLEALTPQPLRAQLWGDYPLPSSPLLGLLGRRGLRLTLSSAQDHMSEGRTAEARRALKLAKSGSPQRPLWALEEARLMSELDLPRVALKRLNDALEEGSELSPPERASLSVRRAALLWRLDQRAESLASLEELSRQGVGEAEGAWLERVLELSEAELEALDPTLNLKERRAQLMSQHSRGPFGWSRPFIAAELAVARGDNQAALAWLAHPLLAEVPIARALTQTLHNQAQPEPKLDPQGAQPPSAPPLLGPSLGELLTASPWGAPWAAKGGAAGDRSPPPVRVLYEHLHLDLDEEGRLIRKKRVVLEVLTPRAAERWRVLRVPHRPSVERLTLHEVSLHRGGEARTALKRTQEPLLDAEARLYYDAVAEVIDFGPLSEGDVLSWSWSSTERHADPSGVRVHGELIALQGRAPKAQARLTLGPRAQARFHLAVEGRDQWVERREGEVVARALPALPLEVNSLKGASALSYVHVSVLRSWGAVRSLYHELLSSVTHPNERLRQLARAWTKGAQGDEEKLRRLYVEVTKRVRYVGLEFGQHSFAPAPPHETLMRGFGDCKDRAALMIALASAVDVPLSFAMVRTASAGRVEVSGAASLGAFDHAALYSPTLKRFLDPTVSHHDPWALPDEDQGAQALIVDPKGAEGAPPQGAYGAPPELVTLPYQAASAHSTHLALKNLSRSKKDAPLIELEWRLSGVEAALARQALEGDVGLQGHTPSRPLSRWLHEQSVAWLPSAQLMSSEVEGLSPALDPLVVRASLTLGARPQLTRLIEQWALLPRFAPTARRVSVWRQLPLSLSLEVPASEHAPPTPPRLPSLLSDRDVRFEVEQTNTSLRLTLHLEGGELSAARYQARRAWLAELEGVLMRWAQAYDGEGASEGVSAPPADEQAPP